MTAMRMSSAAASHPAEPRRQRVQRVRSRDSGSAAVSSKKTPKTDDVAAINRRRPSKPPKHRFDTTSGTRVLPTNVPSGVKQCTRPSPMTTDCPHCHSGCRPAGQHRSWRTHPGRSACHRPPRTRGSPAGRRRHGSIRFWRYAAATRRANGTGRWAGWKSSTTTDNPHSAAMRNASRASRSGGLR